MLLASVLAAQPAAAAAPAVAMSEPAAGAFVKPGPVALRGTATDDVGVVEVWLGIQDRSTLLWWHLDGTWGAFARVPVTITPGVSAAWAYDWTPSAPGDYGVTVFAKDADGSITSAWRSFTVDNVPPHADFNQPSINDEVFGVRPLTFSGWATDDRKIGEVGFAVSDRVTGQWYRPDGTFGDYHRYPTQLTATGEKTANWQFTWTPPRAGQFSLQVVVLDKAGNPDAAIPFRRINVDNTPPRTVIAAPAATDVSTPLNTPVTLSGSATDDYGVSGLWLAVQDQTTRSWLRPDGTWGAFTRVELPVDRPGSPTTSWSYTFQPPALGAFVVQIAAIDRVGLVDQDKPWRVVTAVAPPTPTPSPTPTQTPTPTPTSKPTPKPAPTPTVTYKLKPVCAWVYQRSKWQWVCK
ncbi:Ig-like domain-containing protein [Acrocarpospora catenulata]|uniref:Ig-like domain-containing protein n=1 Tax=Acrocarpospora catenulata TaxID=2836182 RepID=UPI001BD9CB23|nr:Ig-like domain-containing protein [Acrocarpospora catenulata]